MDVSNSIKFRFIDSGGKERTAMGLASLLELSQQGVLTPETLVFDEAEGRWRPACEIEYLAATPEVPSPRPEVKAPELEQLRDSLSAAVPPPPLPWQERRIAPAPTPTPTAIPTPSRGDRLYMKIALVFFAIDAVAIVALFASLPNSKAAEVFGGMSLKGIAGLAALYFTIKGWGKGRALLVVSVLLLLFSGYFAQVLLTTRTDSTRKSEVMSTALGDVIQHTQTFSTEIAELKIENVFAVLDGLQPYSRATLEQLQNNVRIAESKTTEFVAFFENRVEQANKELAAIDPSARSEFMKASIPRIRETYAEQTEYFKAIGAVLKFLLEGNAPFEITSRGIHFEKGTDATIYNSLIDRVNEHSANVNRLRANAPEK
jgi:hypothetical protein